MKYIVYQTTNLINNKIYIGVHKTENPDIFDGYLGCGVKISNPYFINNPKTPFLYALHKYGIKNFRRTTLSVFDTLEEALELEASLVNEDFIKRKDTYNVSLGGNFGNYLFPINQFDNTGKLIQKWDNMMVAAETLGVSHTSINNAKLYKGSCLGYFWSTDEFINPEEFSYHVGTNTYQYDSNYNLIGLYSSITEAAKAVDGDDRAIFRAIKTGMKHREYYWSFDLEFKPIEKISLRGKILYIYDMEGNYLTSLKTGQELKSYYKITHYGCLKEAILNNRPYKNTQISFIKVDKMEKAVSNKFESKKVGRYSINGELLEEFESIKLAVKLYGTGVYKVLKKLLDTTRGFIFKYLS